MTNNDKYDLGDFLLLGDSWEKEKFKGKANSSSSLDIEEGARFFFQRKQNLLISFEALLYF